MTNQEFSDEFDVLYNNIMSNQAPGLDEYEKSVFLTKAQDEIIKSYFNPAYNKSGEGFDDNQRRLIDFSILTKVWTKSNSSDFTAALFDTRANSKSVGIPSDALLIINEQCIVTRGTGIMSGGSELTKQVILQAVPIQYAEYSRLMSKPYKRPLQYQAWRLINTDTATQNDLVVGPSDTITKYVMRYIKRPRAIILTALDGVTLDGVSVAQTCELDPELHHEILLRAVELAKAAYTGTLLDVVLVGSASATEKGFVAKQ